MDSRRLDAALVERGLASGREKAKELVRAGGVRINGRPAAKPSLAVSPADEITVEAGLGQRYVGRGGYKLEKALEKAATIEDVPERAQAYRDKVGTAMAALREVSDRLEMLVSKEYWPIPTYSDLLFQV